MPTVRVTAIKGHDDATVERFMKRVTDLCVEVLGAKEDAVIVHFEMLPPERYMRGGVTVAKRRGLAPP